MNGGCGPGRHWCRTLRLVAVVGAMAGCSSHGSTTARPTTTSARAVTTTTAPAACSPPRRAPSNGPQTLAFGGEARTYLLALPPRYDGRSAYPLVFDFHGFASNGPAQEANTGMGAKGANRGMSW